MNNKKNLYRSAHRLAVITVAYNIIEGVVSLWRGTADETLVLFGFGMDSLIEVISAAGVWHMIRRIQANRGETRDEFERLALRVTGGSFYALTAGLVLTAGINLYRQHQPETTLWGLVISLISLAIMWLLIHHKTKVGQELHSDAILADAACSRTCAYLSLVLLAASAGYQATGIGGLDAIGALALSVLVWKEGREAFHKAKGQSCSCCSPKETR